MTAAAPAPAQHKKILIVDDMTSMANLWKLKFAQMGYDVDMSKDGVDAMHALESQHFDAVLLDLYMPNKNGFEVLEEKSHTQNSSTPTYVVTSSIKEEDISRAKALGAKAAFLKYQTSPKELVSILSTDLKA